MDKSFHNYLVSSHGRWVEDADDYVDLPPGFRIVMLCDQTFCPISGNKNLVMTELMFNRDIQPDLSNIEENLKFLYGTNKKTSEGSACVYSGNINNRFRRDDKSTCLLHHVPNILFSSEEENLFRDGIFQIPVNLNWKTFGSKDFYTRLQRVKKFYTKPFERRSELAQSDAFKDLFDNVTHNQGIVQFKSRYYTFHPDIERNTPVAPYDLRELIEILRKIHGDEPDTMVTIFVLTCVGKDNKKFSKLCQLPIDQYNTQTFTLSGQVHTLAQFDINTMNNAMWVDEVPRSRQDVQMRDIQQRGGRRRTSRLQDLRDKIKSHLEAYLEPEILESKELQIYIDTEIAHRFLFAGRNHHRP